MAKLRLVPELPEVEIWRENLEAWVRGRTIREASAPDELLRGKQSRRSVETKLAGSTIQKVLRRAKFLLFEMDERRPSLLIHLGMTGTFEQVPRGETLPKFTRASLRFTRGPSLAFIDVRRLGEFRLVDGKEEKRLAALGMEPLSDAFRTGPVFELAQRSSRSIKLLLMDQKKIAGIGNIQASEALYRARIHPEQPADALTYGEVKRLVESTRRSLRKTIADARSENLRYMQQGAPNRFRVYGREDEPCPNCGWPIERVVQDGRSSFFCPSCQPAPRAPRRATRPKSKAGRKK